MASLTENPKLPVQHSPVREGQGCDQLVPQLADMRGHGGVPGYPYHPEDGKGGDSGQRQAGNGSFVVGVWDLCPVTPDWTARPCFLRADAGYAFWPGGVPRRGRVQGRPNLLAHGPRVLLVRV